MATKRDDDLSSLTDRQLLLAIYSELKEGLSRVSTELAGMALKLSEVARAQDATAGRTDALITDMRAVMTDGRKAKAELKLAHARVLDLENALASGKRASTARR